MRYVLTFTNDTNGSQASVLCADEADLERQRSLLASAYTAEAFQGLIAQVIPVPNDLDDRDALRTLTSPPAS